MKSSPASIALAITATLLSAAPAAADDAAHIDAYVTPYYDSSGPVVRAGKYSTGLASKNRGDFVATIFRMKKQWDYLNFVELYVAAIRLYDLGYRNESTYWFYTAQYRGRLFASVVDQKRLGGIGDPGFELVHAQDAFFQLAGPDINGFAFGNIDLLVSIVRRVQNRNQAVPNLQTVYPGVSLVPRSQWQAHNAQIAAGLGELATSLPAQKAEIQRRRAQNGTQARFSKLTSKEFPGGL